MTIDRWLTLAHRPSLEHEIREAIGLDSKLVSNFIGEFIEKRSLLLIADIPSKKETKVPKKRSAVNKVKKTDQEDREQCYCMASEHEFVGNCRACGKV